MQLHSSPGPCRVAIADDDRGMRLMLGLLLDGDDRFLRCGEAADGAEAVQLVTDLDSIGEAPDVLLLDVGMPVLDGMEVAAILRERCPHVPIVLYTGYSRDLLAAQAEALGIDTVIEKGSSPAPLLDALANVCVHA